MHFSKGIKEKKCLYLIDSLLLTLCTLLTEKNLQFFIDSETFFFQSFLILLLSFFLLSVLRYVKLYLKTRLEKEGTLEGQRYIVHLAFKNYYNHSIAQDTGSMLFNLTEDVYKLMPWFTYGKLELVLDFIFFVCIFVLMLNIDVYLSVISLICILVSLGCANLLSSKLAKAKDDQQKLSSELNQQMLNSGRNIKTIKQLKKAGFFEKKYSEFIQNKYLPVLKKSIWGQTLFISQLIFSQEIIPFLMLFVGILFALSDATTIGSAIVVMDMTIKLSDSIQSIGENLSQRHLARKIQKRMSLLTDELVHSEGTSLLAPFKSLHIQVHQFQHEQEGPPILKDVDILIRQGETVIIKGESGKGKSTLAKLIAGIIPLRDMEGCIYYNEENVANLSLRDYHRHVLLVPQDTVLIYGTLKENIAMELTIDSLDLDEVLYVCGLSEFVQEHGLDCLISPSKDNISGGEKQRIGIARILIRKPDVLILDEITSALDHELSTDVVERIMWYTKKHSITVISISHGNEFDKYGTRTILL